MEPPGGYRAYRGVCSRESEADADRSMRRLEGQARLADLRKARLYLISAAVFLAACAAAALVPVSSFLKGAFAVPAVGSLLGILVQAWRDQIAHERSVDLLQRQQDFALASASHMAEVAYDKHVQFCEAYIQRTNRGLQELFAEGPSKKALQFAWDLTSIRLEYRAWLTEEIEDKLQPYERALREIGANEELLEHLDTGEERTQIVNAVYAAFKLASGIDHPATDDEKARSAAHVIDTLRDVLGIKHLTALRQAVTRVAIDRLA